MSCNKLDNSLLTMMIKKGKLNIIIYNIIFNINNMN